MSIEEAIVENLRGLSVSKQQEVLEYTEFKAQQERKAARLAAAQAEAQAILNGPFRTLEEFTAAFQKKYNIPDRSHMSEEERQDLLDAEFAAMTPEKIAEAVRAGLL